MGTFYWQARKKYAAQVTMRDGRRSTATCSHDHPTKGRGACQEARDLLLDLERLRSQHAPSNARTLTLGSYLTRWLEDVKPNLAPATWRKYESICRVHLIPTMGTTRLSELSVGAVRRHLGSGRNAQSLRHHRATLRRALADAIRDGYLQRNVAGLAEPPALRHVERTVLNAEQCRTLIEGTQEDRLHALYVLAVTTGMREAEMLGLTWEDVDVEDRYRGDGHARGHRPEDGPAGRAGGDAARPSASVSVRHTLQRVEGQWQLRSPKTDKSRRTIPLPPITVTALKAHRQRQMKERMAAGAPGKEGLVFTTPKGHPIHGSNLLPDFRRHLARLKLPKVTIHDLRHSAATMMFGAGIPLAVISDLLGHSTIRVTGDIYRHAVPALTQDAARRVQEAMGG